MFIVKLMPKSVLSAQARKPTGIIGRYVMTKIFNNGNAFVKEMLDLKKNDRVLEIGFGPGKLINDIAEITTEGIVEGIDFSATMLKQASKVNKHHVLHGKVKLHMGECSNLPYDSDSFDKLCSVNTLYFWKEPDKYFREMFRVIKHGGKIVIGFRDAKQMGSLKLINDIFSTYSVDEVVSMLSHAGFFDPHILDKEGKPLLSYCAVATKSNRSLKRDTAKSRNAPSRIVPV